MCILQELYHELHALDRFEQDYQRKVEEVESLHLPRKGSTFLISILSLSSAHVVFLYYIVNMHYLSLCCKGNNISVLDRRGSLDVTF